MLLFPAAGFVLQGLRPMLLARLPAVRLQLLCGPWRLGAALSRLLGGFALLLLSLFRLLLPLPPRKTMKTLSLTGLSLTRFVTLPLLRLFSARSPSTLNLNLPT